MLTKLPKLKNYLTLILMVFVTQTVFGQGESFAKIHLPAANRGKAVKYNAFGFGAYPLTEGILGANHVNYRRVGYGVSWRMSLRNIQMSKDGFSSINFDTAATKGYLTGKTDLSYSFSANINFVVALTKKIPLYMGLGITRERHFSELHAPFMNPGENEWQLNPHATGFKLNFGGGVFIPLFNRVVLNLGYDHLPQTFFVGIAISGPYNYEDIDMW